MSKHLCHALGCMSNCPPRWLMCRRHWKKVPPDIQVEVYRTVKLRGTHIDVSWAPWWRAQAQAIAAVAHMEQPGAARRDAYLAKEMRVADHMERKRG